MRKTALLFFSLFLISLFPVRAESDLSGRLKFFSSLYLNENQTGAYASHEAGQFAFNRLEARVRLEGYLSDNISYSLRVDTYSRPDALFSGSTFPQSSQLGAPGQVEPVEFSLYEGFIKVADFLFEGLDLTVGKQRISWGTADKINVVDNLNPVDFANFFTFDPDYFAERRPQTAINLEFYLSAMTKLQFVWLPARQYAPLPHDFSEWVSAGADSPEIAVEKDKPLFQNTNLGLRFTTVLLNSDIGLSLYRGNYHLPVLYGLSTDLENSMLLHYSYPQKTVLGCDLSGEIFSLGFWLEAALIIPERVKGFLTVPFYTGDEWQSYTQKFPLLEREYVQYVMGLDYTFDIGSGLYLNAQFLHGFFDERNYSAQHQEYFGFTRGMFFGEIADYLMLNAEYSLFNTDLKLVFGQMVEFAGKKIAAIFMPSLEYRMFDYFIIQAGTFLAAGSEEETKFGPFKRDKLFFFAFKINF